MKTLTIVSTNLKRPSVSEAMKLEGRDRYPRVSLYPRFLESDILDERFLRETVPPWRRLLYRIVPSPLDQVVEAFLIRERYDVVITWAERVGLPFALLLKLTRSTTPHITLSSWISPAKKAYLLRLVHSHISRILLWSSVQRDFAVTGLGIPPGKISFIRKYADQQFWRPFDVETDTICSVGVEMRDYPTLIGAIRGLDIPCHIAAGINRGKLYDTVAAIHSIPELPANLTVGKLPWPELRDLYARSRFVVIPLRQTDTDNGLTCILEAMAMGKAVICTRTTGQVDVLQDGVTGLFVPEGDPGALREAIVRLWNDPARAREMGKAARKFIEKHHSLEQFVLSVRQIAEDVSGHTGDPRPFDLSPPVSPEGVRQDLPDRKPIQV